ncbi:hypothetical protein ACRALDRAFT_2044768 [Sodiomyces alcalophilus JCM 7366]|uniref:uncharacterized protein n=1 Tax=Sodiomyces alcalophilus JCM 7366 TaxID=591952 RepID=UPI0039B4CB5A
MSPAVMRSITCTFRLRRTLSSPRAQQLHPISASLAYTRTPSFLKAHPRVRTLILKRCGKGIRRMSLERGGADKTMATVHG